MKPAPFRLERYFAAHEFSAPYLLCSSDCESVDIRELLALEPQAHDDFLRLRLGYTESLGSPDLRRAITALYAGIAADEVLVHAGAEEAIFNFMHVALEVGDQVIVHSPYYQSLGEVARALGAEVAEWRGDPEHGWALDLAALRQQLTPRTRVVVVNFPHNPTGFLPTGEFVRELSALAEQRGFIVFSDEVYRGLEAERTDRLPAFADVNERAVSLGVLSKTYGLPGLRIGWIATHDRELYRRMAAFKDYTTICNSAPSEFLATLALRHAETLAARNQQIIQDNLDRLDGFFAAHMDVFAWHRPKAGSVAFPALRRGNVEAFCAKLIRDAGVLLLPGALYGPDLNCFRIGFGRKNLPAALHRLEAYMREARSA